MFQSTGKYDNLVNDISNLINKKEEIPQEIQDAAAAASKEIAGKSLEDRQHIMTKHLLDTGISISSKMSKQFENLVEQYLTEASTFGPVKVPAKVLKDWASQLSEVSDKKVSAKQVKLAADKAIQDGQLEFLRPKGKWVSILEPEELVSLASFIKGVEVSAP